MLFRPVDADDALLREVTDMIQDVARNQGGGVMKVDPEQLRALAATLDSASSAIDGIEVRASCDAVAAAMPGTDLGQVAARAGEFVEGAYLRVSWRVSEISEIAQGNARNYDVEESEFSERLGAMGHAE